MILFTLLGYYLDHKRETGHFWTVGGMFMGIAYAGYEFWSTLRLLNPPEPPKPEPPAAQAEDARGKPGGAAGPS